MNTSHLKKIKQFAQQYHQKTDQFHDWNHIEYVRRNALSLAKKYPKTNTFILQAACYLHDIGRSVQDEGHPVESARMAKPFLHKIGLTAEEVESVLHAVLSHDRDKIGEAKTIEAKLLFDADKLEIMSLYGFMRVWAFLIEQRKMPMNKAMDFLWEWIEKTNKMYIQTKEARAIVNKEKKKIIAMKKDFMKWQLQK